jgi:hypothetical protein
MRALEFIILACCLSFIVFLMLEAWDTYKDSKDEDK